MNSHAFALYSLTVVKYFYCFLFLFLLKLWMPSVVKAQTATLDKAVDVSTAASGENLKYTLTYGCSSLDADCIGAILIDTLPPDVTYVSSNQAIVTGSTGTFVISPVYDEANHVLTWDFTTISPEGGLPDGASGTVEVIVNIKPGITPNGIRIVNNSILDTDNAGSPIDSAITTVEGVSPQWSITKSVSSGPIYHDRPVEYGISVCSDSPTGNLHLLPGATVTDILPPGAVFTSASDGGTHDGGTPGTVTWTISDTMKVDDPCRIYSIVVEYPAADVNNQTGLDTPIEKINEVTLDAVALGGEPVTDTATVNNPLLPPVFMIGVRKTTGNGNGATPIGTTNKFIIHGENASTVSIDNFIITDIVPAQADITEIHIEPSVNDTVFANIRVQLNNSGTWIDFQTGVSTAAESEFDVTTIPGWDVATSYVSHVEYNFGTVQPDFNIDVELIFEPAYPTANDGSNTALDTAYTNTAEGTYIRPLDGMTFTEASSTTFCVVDGQAARIDPDKAVEINYVETPAGDPTTGNPYFQGARVKYTLHIGNDGSDGADDDDEITADSSFSIVTNPIGADLLPAEMSYEDLSWTIINNTSDEIWDNSGTNPSFEVIEDFNNTGKTLLRWAFTGDLEPGEGVDICFNAFIRDTVTAGTIIDNGFAMTSTVDIYCDEGDCEPAGTNPELNNYFGDSGDPSTLLPGITEMCQQSVTFEVADTTSVPVPTKSVSSSGPYAPGESAPAELGLASDTVIYSIGFCNEQEANFTLPDPVLVDLLPVELLFVPGSLNIINNTTGLTFENNPTELTNPVFEVIEDFAGTGRQLLRWTFNGEIPINACIEYSFQTSINTGSGGLVANEPYVAAGVRKYECVNGGVVDNMDMDGDGVTVGDTLCAAANSADILIPEIRSMGAKKFVKGAKDADYIGSDLGVLGVGCTYPVDSVLWRFRIFNPGNVTLTDAAVVDIFPYIGDTGVQLTGTARETEWEPYLVESIAAPHPDIQILYSQSKNPCRPEINPEDETGCVDDWTSTPPVNLSTVKSVKFDFANKDIEPAEEFWFDIKMLAPDSIDMSPGIAWNSMARNANEVPAQEPNKVGIVIQGYDLALRKQLKAGQSLYAEPGEDVDFTITVVNQSSDSVKNITITDYIPTLMTQNDGDWTDEGGNVASYLLAGPLAPNDSIDIDITLTISGSAMTGDELDNFAEISDFEDLDGNHPPDWDSYADTNPTNDAGGTINSDADDVTSGHGRGTVPGTDAASDEDDHDGARIIICPNFTQNSAQDQEVCTDNLAALQDIKIPTTADVSQNVKFVYYTSPQADSSMYNGLGTDLLTANPVADTVTLPIANIPTSIGTYYIYAILDPKPSEPNCRPFDEVVLIVNPPITAEAGANTEICFGENTNLTASAIGGNGNYAYEWSTSATTATINVSPLVTTDYFVTITDSSDNCVGTDVVTVSVNPLPTVDLGADIDTCINSVVTLVATTGAGTPAYTYLWSDGTTNNSIDVAVEDPTNFSVTVTDSKGCTATDDLTVLVPVAEATPSEVTICQNNNTTLTATGGVDYEWSSGDLTASTTVSPLTTTTYYVTVTNDKNCTDIDSALVIVNPLPVFEKRDTNSCLGESVNLTSLVTDYNMIFNPTWTEETVGGTVVANPFSVSPNSTTDYVMVGEDANGCTDTIQIVLTIYPLPILSTSPDTTICLGDDANLSVSATEGTPAYTFTWDKSLSDGATQTVSPSVNTTYNVTVTDSNTCTDNGSIAVTVIQPFANAGNDETICIGDTIPLTASGGVSYQWSTGETTATIMVGPTSTTTYTVTVTEANDCVDTDEVVVNVNPQPVFVARDTMTCPDELVDLTSLVTEYNNISNPMWYEVMVGGTSVSNPTMASSAVTIDYVLVGENANGCKDTVQFNLMIKDTPILSLSPDVTICEGNTTDLSASAIGGAPAYTFSWDNGLPDGSSQTVAPNYSTTYNVVVMDANGCEDTGSLRVSVTPMICQPIEITINRAKD